MLGTEEAESDIAQNMQTGIGYWVLSILELIY